MIEAILVRHAESEANAMGIVNGDASIPYELTAEGRKQAATLARALAGERIDLCVVTEFLRTRQTADLALGDRDVPRVVMPELNDPVFGVLEGRSLADARDWLVEHGPAAHPDGGESRVETIARYSDGFRRLMARPEGVALVVAHALPVTIMRLAVEESDLPLTLTGVPPDHAHPYRLAPDQMRRGLAVMNRWVRQAVGA
jgi:2,3-bisphosphoglycerate-dependent phosphoglycerate mutase